MLYRYKDDFILRDVTATCLNIEAEIDDTDKFPFFIRPYHEGEDKTIVDKVIKRLLYLCIVTEGF